MCRDADTLESPFIVVLLGREKEPFKMSVTPAILLKAFCVVLRNRLSRRPSAPYTATFISHGLQYEAAKHTAVYLR